MLRVLGGLAVSTPRAGDPGRPLPVERKARELATLLVLHTPAALGTDELVRLLWEEPPVSAVRTLRSHVSRVRGALTGAGHPDAVVSARGDSYRLADGVPTDVGQVTRLRRLARQFASEGRHDEAAARLAEARLWWSGAPALPSTVAGEALFAGWERERRIVVAEHLEAVVLGSRPEDALGELARLTADDPLDEPAWVLHVRALHRVGLQADALAAVARARGALASVGLDPGPALVAAQAAVLAGPAVPGPAPSTRGASEAVDRVRYAGGGTTAYIDLSDARPGDDRPAVVVLNPGMLTIDGLLDEVHVRSALTRLAERVRPVCLDRRGIGLSAPLRGGTDPLALWVEDVGAVIDDAGLRKPVLLANFDTGLVALEYAARDADTVAGLVLVNCYATYRRGRGYPHGLDPGTTGELIDAAVDPSRDRPLDTSVLVAPSLAADAAFRAWWNRIGRRGANPTTARIVREVATATDLRDRLPAVTCPVLVVVRRQCANVDPAHSAYLAEHLPRARLHPLDGADAVWFTDHEVADIVAGFASLGPDP
jgi:pimeloyl-ACP methyl ester carboxylesterase/DNA-binding SARP family transcriptional activator